MQINKTYKLHSIADQSVIILQGKHGADTTKVLQLNATSVWLWHRFVDVEVFSLNEVVAALEQHYKIDRELAQRDAEQWVSDMTEYNIMM